MSTAGIRDKPWPVTWAVRLFWVTIVLAIIKLTMTLGMPARGSSHGVVIASFIALCVLMALTIVYINQGASWARGVMAVLFLIGIAPALPIVFRHFQALPILASLTLAQTIAQVVGLYFVYSQPGAQWFARSARD